MNKPFSDYAQVFNAMADELRLKVLLYLYVNGERCVCDIGSYFNIGQSGISYHLKILHEANIINKRKVAVWNYYSLNQNNDIYELLKDIFKNVNKEEWKHNVSNG